MAILISLISWVFDQIKIIQKDTMLNSNVSKNEATQTSKQTITVKYDDKKYLLMIPYQVKNENRLLSQLKKLSKSFC